MHKPEVVSIKLNGKPVSEMLAEDLTSKSINTTVAVITDRPYVLSSVVRKRWLKKLRHLYIKRARLLAGMEATQLSAQIEALRRVQFGAHDSVGSRQAHITFMTIEDLISSRSKYRLIFITYKPSSRRLEQLTASALGSDVIILYEE